MPAESDFFISDRGVKLHYRYWLPQGHPDTLLCIIHGHGEHSGRYDEMSTYLNEANHACFALDLRGHGLSEGKRGHARSLDQLLDDIEEFLKVVREKYNETRLILMGHSMGGNLVANYLIRDQSKEISSFILSAPWFKLAFAPPKLKLKLGHAMARIWPGFTEHNNLQTSHLSKDRAEVSQYQKDPLVHGKISAGLFAAIIKGAKRALSSSAEIRQPGMVYHGDSDQIIDFRASQKFAENSTAQWILLPGVYHEPHHDLEKNATLIMIRNWLSSSAAP